MVHGVVAIHFHLDAPAVLMTTITQPLVLVLVVMVENGMVQDIYLGLELQLMVGIHGNKKASMQLKLMVYATLALIITIIEQYHL